MNLEINIDAEQFSPAEFNDFSADLKDQYQNILEELRTGEATGRPIQIIEASIPPELPTFRDIVEKFTGNNEVLQSLLYLYKFISTPIILDNFDDDDDARTSWERKVEEKSAKGNRDRGTMALVILNQNKLRFNAYNNVNYGMQILRLFDNEQFPSEQYFSRLEPEIFDSAEYHKLSLEEKRNLADKTTKLACEVIKSAYDNLE